MSDMSCAVLENLLQKYNVSPSFLNQQCDDVLLFSLAFQIQSFEATTLCFGLTQSKIQEIQQNFPKTESMKIQMMWDWKRRQRNNATYFAIFEVLQNMKGDQNMCEFAIQHVTKLSLKQQGSPPIISRIYPNKFYLYWEKLSKLERDELTCAIYDENEEIRSIFASLVSDILDSFEARRVDVNELKHFLISLGTPVAIQHSEGSASCFNYLRNATNLAEMFVKLLLNHLSWFNISLLKRLVSDYGSQNDQQMTKQYEKINLLSYLERAICFIPSDSYVSCFDTTNAIFLRIKLPSETTSKGQDSYVLKQNLSQHLCINDGILQMVRYEAESNEVVFALSEVTRRFSVKQYIIRESTKSYRLKL